MRLSYFFILSNLQEKHKWCTFAAGFYTLLCLSKSVYHREVNNLRPPLNNGARLHTYQAQEFQTPVRCYREVHRATPA